MYIMCFAEIYNKLDKKRQIDEQDEIEPSENDKKDIKLELSDITQFEKVSEPELSDIKQSEKLQEELKPELSDIKQSEEPEKTLDEFCASLFPKSDKSDLKKYSQFDIEIDFEKLDALLN